MQTKGGRITINFGMQRVSARGAVKIMPTTVEAENGVNMDGTGYTTIKPALASADMTFDRNIRITNAMMLETLNVTFREDDTGITHLFTGARISGRPELDTSTGEISGLKVETDSYSTVGG